LEKFGLPFEDFQKELGILLSHMDSFDHEIRVWGRKSWKMLSLVSLEMQNPSNIQKLNRLASATMNSTVVVYNNGIGIQKLFFIWLKGNGWLLFIVLSVSKVVICEN